MSEINQLFDVDEPRDIRGRLQALPTIAALRPNNGIAPLPHPQCFRVQPGKPGGDTTAVLASA